jgi:hypothetical protein
LASNISRFKPKPVVSVARSRLARNKLVAMITFNLFVTERVQTVSAGAKGY